MSTASAQPPNPEHPRGGDALKLVGAERPIPSQDLSLPPPSEEIAALRHERSLAARRADRLTVRVSELERQLNEQIATVARLQAQLAELTSSNHELNRTADDARSSARSLQHRLTEATEAKERLKSRLSSLLTAAIRTIAAELEHCGRHEHTGTMKEVGLERLEPLLTQVLERLSSALRERRALDGERSRSLRAAQEASGSAIQRCAELARQLEVARGELQSVRDNHSRRDRLLDSLLAERRRAATSSPQASGVLEDMLQGDIDRLAEVFSRLHPELKDPSVRGEAKSFGAALITHSRGAALLGSALRRLNTAMNHAAEREDLERADCFGDTITRLARITADAIHHTHAVTFLLAMSPDDAAPVVEQLDDTSLRQLVGLFLANPLYSHAVDSSRFLSVVDQFPPLARALIIEQLEDDDQKILLLLGSTAVRRAALSLERAVGSAVEQKDRAHQMTKYLTAREPLLPEIQRGQGALGAVQFLTDETWNHLRTEFLATSEARERARTSLGYSSSMLDAVRALLITTGYLQAPAQERSPP